MAQTTILEEQTLEGFVDGVLEELTVSASVVVTAGQTYTVAWDGTEYTCEAFQLPAGDMTFTCLGKGTMFGIETGEYPFVLAYASAEITGGDPMIQVICEDTESTTHTLAIYQGEAVGVILKDRDGEDRVYYGVEAVKLVTTDGGTQLFSRGEAAENVRIVPDFSGGDMAVEAAEGTLIKSAVVVKPEMLVPENIALGVNVAGVTGTYVTESEAVTVTADFSGGDMKITPGEGVLLSGVTVTKPAALTPENIAEGVDIAGVVGTLAGGGGGSTVTAASGSYKATGTGAHTVTHGLGVVPDLIRIYSNTAGAGCFVSIVAKSGALLALTGGDGQNVLNYTASQLLPVSFAGGLDSSNSYGYISGATTSTFKVGGSVIKHVSGATYYWEAIAGLT